MELREGITRKAKKIRESPERTHLTVNSDEEVEVLTSPAPKNIVEGSKKESNEEKSDEEKDSIGFQCGCVTLTKASLSVLCVAVSEEQRRRKELITWHILRLR
jgi:hypothetical protein